MNQDEEIILSKTLNNLSSAVALVAASLKRVKSYDVNQEYTIQEMEPYDALSSRFIRAVEMCISFFKTYDQFVLAGSFDTVRDLLNNMEKVDFISSVSLWINMRNVRNQVVHTYSAEDIKKIYDNIIDHFGPELLKLKEKTKKIT